MPGGSVNLTCVAVGAPMPYVKWMMGAEELTKEDEMPVGRNVLELNNVVRSANYTCVAISSLGMIEAMAQVTVKGERQGARLLWGRAGPRRRSLRGASALGSSWPSVVEGGDFVNSLHSS